MSVTDAQKDEHVISADQEQDRVQRYKARFNRAEQAAIPKHEVFKTLDTFDRGDQWKDVALPPWIPKPTTNFIRYVRQLKRANLATAIPKAHFSPIDIEDAEHISRIQAGYNHTWEEQKVSRIIRRCIDRSMLQGMTIAYAYNDQDEISGTYNGEYDPKNKMWRGKICIERIPTANFFPDPDATELQKCKYVDITSDLTLAEIKYNPKFRKYCKENGTLDKLKEMKTAQVSSDDNERGTIYDRDHKPGEDQTGHGDESVTIRCHWEKYVNEDGKWQVDVSYYPSHSDFFLYRAEDVKPSRYPFEILYDEEEEGEIWGHSQAMDMFENQKIINKTAQTASIIATLHQNPQKVVSKASGINAQDLSRTGTLPGKVWTTNEDPTKSIHNVIPPDIPKGLFEVEDRMKQDIREMAGVNEAYTGQSVGSLTTSTGVNSLIDRATIRDKDKMIQIDAFVEGLSNLIVLLMLHNWNDERPLAYTGTDGQPVHDTWKKFTGEEIANLSWRVKCDTYAVAPVTQQLRKQQADNLMQMQGQFQFNPPVIVVEEWIQAQDMDNKERILQRMKIDRARMEKLAAQDLAKLVAQAAQQMDQLIQQGQPPQQVQQQMVQWAEEMLQKNDPRNAGQPQPMGSAAGQQAPKAPTGQMAMQAQAVGR